MRRQPPLRGRTRARARPQQCRWAGAVRLEEDPEAEWVGTWGDGLEGRAWPWQASPGPERAKELRARLRQEVRHMPRV